ncbi:cupin domain-containing protein [Xylogone sp. PMI_703]|nr:cupin domain-containing protein [Xylogone sp. PMI_703]
MASASPPRRKPRENQFLFDLGVRGRKTGITIPDSGIRDEHGLEPMEHLFSSPEKEVPQSTARMANGMMRNPNATISSEEDMDIGNSSIPEPTTVLTERRRASIRFPPKSKSPIKTFLQSPARRPPSLGPVLSSPSRSINTSRVARKLDFGADDLVQPREKIAESPVPSITKSANRTLGNGINVTPSKKARPVITEQRQQQYEVVPTVDEEEESAEENGGDYINNDEPDEEPIDQIEGPQEEEEEESEQVTEPELEPEPVPEPEPEPININAGNKRKERDPVATETAVKRGKGRPPREPEGLRQQSEEGTPPKKARTTKEQPSKVAAKPQPSKAPSRKKDSATVTEVRSPEIIRAPPMPRRNRGLFILRRETPDGFQQTRSGRTSVKPVAWWKNERIEYDEEEAVDGRMRFVLPKIKEVVRADEVEEPKKQRAKSKKDGKSKKRQHDSESEDEEEDETEPWELDPGRFVGEIRGWDPEDAYGYDAELVEEEIALSSAAIVTGEIAGASFRFAKTLSLPFFGSGVVDLPPGAVKKPKNSRRMQMVFFVFYGRVQVTVNDNTFRIGKGGMWQVPRGNFYSIVNDYDKPARIFFSQGCDMREEQPESR